MKKNKIIKLKNGIEVVCIHTNSPLIKMRFLLKAGSSQDMEGKYGLAHFLEHMAFNGTHKHSKMHIEKSLNLLGKQDNASTDYNSTYYEIDVLKDDVDAAMSVFSDMICNPSFLKNQIRRERDVVLEELNEFSDIPEEAFFDEKYSVIFEGHGLSHPVLGYKKDLISIAREDFIKFHEKYYCKNNFRVIFCGDISCEKAIFLTNKYFSNMPDGEKVILEKPTFNIGYKFIEEDLNSSVVELCFNNTAANTKKMEQFVLQKILSGMVYLEATNQSLSYCPSVFGDFLNGCSMLNVSGKCSKRNVNKLLEVFISAINELKDYPISENEVSLAKKSIKIKLIDDYFDNGYAMESALTEFDADNIELDYENRLKEIDTISAESLQMLAIDLFSVKNMGYFLMGERCKHHSLEKVQKMLM